MRPLIHPAIEDIRPETILHALSDPERVAIYANLSDAETARTCSALADTGERVIPKSSLSAHFKVLREAGLIRSERHGVEIRNQSRCGELDEHLKVLVQAIMGAYGWYYGTRNRAV
jgi:DNA-binding transcriptional ArsR family regulator